MSARLVALGDMGEDGEGERVVGGEGEGEAKHKTLDARASLKQHMGEGIPALDAPVRANDHAEVKTAGPETRRLDIHIGNAVFCE
eukprot:3685005-Pyramimonas_sp.AAC.1